MPVLLGSWQHACFVPLNSERSTPFVCTDSSQRKLSAMLPVQLDLREAVTTAGLAGLQLAVSEGSIAVAEEVE